MRRSGQRRTLASLAILLIASLGLPQPGAAADAARFVGRPLAEALQALQREGLPLVFTSAVVSPEMVVRVAPRATDPRAVLDELLAPHGLAASPGPGGRLVVVRKPLERSTAPPFEPAAPRISDELLVTTPAGESRHGEPVGATVLEITTPHRDVPHAGNDPFRAVALLPSVAAAGDSSAQLSVRGGRPEDVLVLLDGLELIAPYHLPEFDNALGIVPDGSLQEVELIVDPVPVEYGDRLGGVIDMRTRAPQAPLGMDLGVGSLFAEASAAGLFAQGRGRWLGAARAGNYRLALEANDRHDDPRYGDLFAKADYDLRLGQSILIRALAAGDDFEAKASAVGGGDYRSHWRNSYAWLSHVGAVGASGLAESVVWGGRIERRRTADQARQASARFDIDDERDLFFTGGKSVWRWAPAAARWSLDGGVEWRQIRSSIDYAVVRADELAGTGGAPSGSDYQHRFDFEQLSAFASGRLWSGRVLTVESGLRWEHTGLTDEEHWSPRLHVAWTPDSATVVRVAIGSYYQSQRPYELQVEDGETELWPAERSTQGMLSYERRLRGGASWRAGVWARHESRPRPRFESLFDSAVLYPELAPGRARLAPESGRARGFELLFRSARGERLAWSAAYAFGRVEDRIGDRWVPRATDAPHEVELQGHLQLPHRWTLSAVWHYHTGWPTTAIAARVGEGGIEPVLGPVRGERLPDYHRLDLRLGRDWDLSRGRLIAWLDLQGVYDRNNARGLGELRFVTGEDGEPRVLATRVGWGGFQPAFGLRWSF